MEDFTIRKGRTPNVEFLLRRSHKIATKTEPTPYDRFLKAVENMRDIHGHADEDGLREAWEKGESFNKEKCWRCGMPRFKPSKEVDGESD